MEVDLGPSVSHHQTAWYSNNNAEFEESQIVDYDYDQPIQPFLSASDVHLFVEKIESDFERENYDQVLKDLSTLVVHYGAQSGISTEEIQTAYALVKRLIPHLEVKPLNKFIDQLTDFLIKTKAFPEEHLAVANLIGNQHVRHKNGKAAMHYFAKALVIAKRYNLKEEENLNSPLFLSCIFQDKVKQIFQKAINKAVGNSDPQLFKAQLDRIRDLQAFCHPHDYPCIRSLYEQAQEAIFDINSERRGNFSPLLEFVIQGLTKPFVSSEVPPLERYRNALDDFRDQFDKLYRAQQNILDPKGVRHLQREVTQHFKRLFKIFLTDIFTILGEPTFDYDFRAMGSLGREEMCPYSDLEWFALVSDLKFQSDITMIAELLELQVISLGETNLENPVCFSSVPLKSGLHIDVGSNPARTKQNQDLSLIGTPSDLAREQTPHEEDIRVAANDTSSTMRKSASLASKGSLIEQYEQESRDILVSPVPQKEITPLYKTVGERRAIRFLEKHLEDFKAIWRGPPEGLINFKAQYVELINHLMTTLALFYNLSETNTLDILDRLTEKEVFTPCSGQLLKERIAGLYMIRVRSHFLHEEQKEDIRFEELKQAEKDLLTSTYWLVLKPLYHLIEKWLEVKKPMIQADLIDIAVEQMIANLSSSIKNPSSFNYYAEVISLIAFFIGSTEDPQPQHFKVYKKLSRFSKFEPLREAYLNWVDRQTLEGLLEIPNSAGLRRAYFRDYQNLEQAFTSLTTHQFFPGAVKVTTTFLKKDKDKAYYLKPEVAEAILEKGTIKRHYLNSVHQVTPYEINPQYNLHFKGIPSHPMMEYAIHALTSRIMGKGTPPVHLIRLDIENKPYPVLVSETIPGKALGDKNPSYDLKHLTWMLLCQVITHPGDGRPPNFVVDGQGRIFCVDNDVSLIEAVVDKSVYFASALFCLKGTINGQVQEILQVALDKEVVKQFCALDVLSLLEEWLDEVIEEEDKALNLFNKEEREALFREDFSNLATIKNFIQRENQQELFTPRILFQKGTIASLCAQFLSLQKALSEKCLQNVPITPLDLLQSLTTLGKRLTDQASLGIQVSKVYERAQKESTLEKRYKQITGRIESISRTKSHTIIYGKPLSIKDIEEGEIYSPLDAKEELSLAKLTWVRNAKVIQDEEAITLKVDFSNIKQSGFPDSERQRFLLNGLHLWMNSCENPKPSQIHITHCYVMNEGNLLPFLHQDLQVLNLTGCSGITNSLILQIEKNCLKLQKLYLNETGITTLVKLNPNPVKSSSPITMPNLRILHLSRCPKLEVIKLDTPFLEELKVEENTVLKSIKFSDLYSVNMNTKFEILSLRNTIDIPSFIFKQYKQAIMGDSSAQVDLAIRFHKGDGVRQNAEKCVYWHERAAANDPKAQAGLALRFDIGDGVTQNTEKCVYWHEKAVANDPKTQVGLALRFHTGDGVTQNPEKCVYWHERAVANDPKAQAGLALRFHTGDGVTQNPEKCVYWHEKAVANDPKTQVGLALRFHKGNGVNQNYQKAFFWYQKSSNNHSKSQLGLAQLYFNGQGVERDLEQAVYWSQMAASNEIGARRLLAQCCIETPANLTHIANLDLHDCSDLTDQILESLVKKCPNLIHLNLSGCKQITDASLAHLTPLTQLQKLSLYQCNKITDAGLAHLTLLTQLQKLVLSHCNQITDAGLAHLTPLTQLQYLSLSHCDKITDAGLAHLTPLTQLQILYLENCDKITDASLAHLTPLTQLQILSLYQCNKITDASLAHLTPLTQLQQLVLSHCDKITDAGLAHIKTLTQLQILSLENCDKITDAGLAHLTPLTQLQILSLKNCDKITDAGIAHLKALTQLQQLDLKNCYEITDAGLAHIKILTQLQMLSLKNCDKITDAGLAHIKTLTQLQTLNLSYCYEITDAGIAHLKTLTQLKIKE